MARYQQSEASTQQQNKSAPDPPLLSSMSSACGSTRRSAWGRHRLRAKPLKHIGPQQHSAGPQQRFICESRTPSFIHESRTQQRFICESRTPAFHLREQDPSVSLARAGPQQRFIRESRTPAFDSQEQDPSVSLMRAGPNRVSFVRAEPQRFIYKSRTPTAFHLVNIW